MTAWRSWWPSRFVDWTSARKYGVIQEVPSGNLTLAEDSDAAPEEDDDADDLDDLDDADDLDLDFLGMVGEEKRGFFGVYLGDTVQKKKKQTQINND